MNEDENRLLEWLKGRPASIVAAVRKRHPYRLWRLNNQIVYIMSYMEPDNGPGGCEHCKAGHWPAHLHQGSSEEVTVSVGLDRKYNPHLLLLIPHRIWGVKLDDLVPLSPEEQALFDRFPKADSN